MFLPVMVVRYCFFDRRRSLSRIMSVKSAAGRISKGQLSHRVLRHQLDGLVQVPGFEQEDSAQLLFGLAYGPSVMDTLPFFQRKVVAFRGFEALPGNEVPVLS